MNPFDAFDPNPFDEFDTKKPAASIPGAEAYDREQAALAKKKAARTSEQVEKERLKAQGESILGAGEAAYALLHNTIGMGMAVPTTAVTIAAKRLAPSQWKQELESNIGKFAYSPKTETGAKLSEWLANDVLAPFGMSPYANIGQLGARGAALGRRKVPKSEAVSKSGFNETGYFEPQREVGLSSGQEFPAPVDQAYLASRRAEEASIAHSEKLASIDEQIAQRQRELEQDVKRNIQIQERDAIIARLEQERAQQSAAFESAEQARMAEEAAVRERQFLSTGENVPGGRIINRKPTTDSGLMGLPPTEPVGLSTGEGMPSVADPTLPAGPSNLMGAPEGTPTPPVGLSTGEGGVARAVANQRVQGPSNLMGESPPKPFDPWGSIGGMGRRQRGAINTKLFSGPQKVLSERPLDSLGESFKGLKLRTVVGEDSPGFLIQDSSGNEVAFMSLVKNGDNAEVGRIYVEPEYRNKGIADGLYNLVNALGNDIVRSSNQTDMGKTMWDRWEASGKSTGGMRRSQQGGIDFKQISEGIDKIVERFKAKPDTIQTPTSQENLVAKRDLVGRQQVVNKNVKTGLEEWTDPQTFEEAKFLALEKGDIRGTRATRQVAPGINFMSAYHNHPVLKYARKLFTEARAASSEFSQMFVTGKDGFTTKLLELSPEDWMLASKVIKHHSKTETNFNADKARANGMPENIISLIDAHDKANAALWVWNKKNTNEQGVRVARELPGYSPGLLEGTYRSLVLDKDGKVIAFLGDETPGGFERGMAYYRKKYGKGITFSHPSAQKALKSFGNTGAGRASRYNELGSMLHLLEELQANKKGVLAKAEAEGIANDVNVFGMAGHNKYKKHIEGAIGDRPWLSAEENAKQHMDGLIQFFEQSAEHHALQPALKEMRKIREDAQLSQQTNLQDYLKKYEKNFTGTYQNPLGEAINLGYDIVSNHILTGALGRIPGVKNHVSPTGTIKVSNAIRNKMSAFFMGWYNPSFLMSQILQPVQNGVPMMHLVANRIGVSATDANLSFIEGARHASNYGMREFLNLNVPVEPWVKEALDWGNRRGILDFTEHEKAYSGTEGKLGRAVDKTGNWMIAAGEHASRPAMFLGFVDMLRKSGETDILTKADYLTKQVLGDYHPSERPMLYTGAGVIGPHMGSLRTYPHSNASTQILFAKEAKKTGNVSPLALTALTTVLFGGITGMMAYDHADQLFQAIYHKLTGRKQSIREVMLETTPEWLDSGIISSVTGMYAQNKFSSAELAPDLSTWEGVAKAASPYVTGAAQIGGQLYESFKDPSEANLANAALAVTPSGMKQAVRSVVKREDGNVLDKENQVIGKRTPEQWVASSVLGLAPLDEALGQQKVYQNKVNEAARRESLTKLSKKFDNAVRDNDLEKQQELIEEYASLGGSPSALMRRRSDVLLRKQQTQQTREQGRPTTRSGYERYEEFQK